LSLQNIALHTVRYSTVRRPDQDANFLHDDQLRLNFTFVGERTFVSGQRTGFAFPEKEKKINAAVPPSCCGYAQYDAAAAATGTSGYGLAGTPRGLEERPLPRLAAAQLKKLQHGHN
jgi:hypothetical protein